jgi:glutamyl-tRNA synthetase
MVHGRIEVENGNIGDFVIARGDGSPLYNFTNVVDDLDMGITHIIRGEDHVSNTPKQVLLYQALGAEPPRFAHLPMILGTDKQKLSKRHGATGVHEFDEKGILPAALVNFLALLGWAPAEAEFNEVMTLDELAAKFTLDRVNKSPAVFDHEKLLWMNGVYIRQMPPDELRGRVLPVLEERFGPRGGFRSPNPAIIDADWLNGIVALVTERCRTITEFAEALEYFFRAPESYDEKATKKFIGTPEQAAQLRESGRVLAAAWDTAPKPAPDEIAAWGAAMEAPLRTWADAKGIKFGNVAQPIRLAVTGRTASPPLFDVLWHLGKNEVARRIDACASRARL